ncbi:hypothetical protein EDD85DRAFT_961440 [Armillaria nabsnona]|nr:hypothetical protein EDD85DRAFT_961440 [Armillaria nabsnona]
MTKTTRNDDKSGSNDSNDNDNDNDNDGDSDSDSDDDSDNDDNDGDDGNNNNNDNDDGGDNNNIGNNNSSGSSDETTATTATAFSGWIGYRYSVWPHEDDAPPTTEPAANSKTTRLDAAVDVHGCPHSILFKSITSPDPHHTSYHPPFPVPAPIHDWTAGIF